jgi:hypothetical protein
MTTTGYVYAFGPCIGCGESFGYNPLRVPSTSAVTGKREPLCRNCVAYVNDVRGKAGLDAIEVAPDAYEAVNERELP